MGCTLTANGEQVDVLIERQTQEEFKLFVSQERVRLVLTWLRDLSDGYIGRPGRLS